MQNFNKLFKCVVLSVFLFPAATANASLHADQAPKSKPSEEIEVTGNRILEQLRTRLKEGFTAYMNGDFVEAERQFSSEIKIDGNYMLRQTENLLHMANLMGINRPIIPSLSGEQRVYLGAVYYMRGMSQARQGKTDSAKVSLRKAIKINAKNFDARVDYALLELQSGNHRKAEKQMKKLRKLLKKCKDVTVGECDDLGNRFDALQTVYAQTSVN